MMHTVKNAFRFGTPAIPENKEDAGTMTSIFKRILEVMF